MSMGTFSFGSTWAASGPAAPFGGRLRSPTMTDSMWRSDLYVMPPPNSCYHYGAGSRTKKYTLRRSRQTATTGRAASDPGARFTPPVAYARSAAFDRDEDAKTFAAVALLLAVAHPAAPVRELDDDEAWPPTCPADPYLWRQLPRLVSRKTRPEVHSPGARHPLGGRLRTSGNPGWLSVPGSCGSFSGEREARLRHRRQPA